MNSKHIHPAAWEVDWILHHHTQYDNSKHARMVQKNIVTRKSFTSGVLLNDKTVFHKGPAFISMPALVGQPITEVSLTKAMRVTCLPDRWSCGSSATIALYFHHAAYSFERLQSYNYPDHDEVCDSPEEFLKSGFLKDNQLEQAIFQMLSKEIGQKTAIFVTGNSSTNKKCITMVADIHGLVFNYKVNF